MAEHEPLRDLIAAEIRRDGPMTFARFMELALYAPDLGYYTSDETRIGRQGDFLTAPETHPIFGAAIARHVAATWDALGNPDAFTVREYGAGTGALATAILDAARTDHRALAGALRYEAIDRNPRHAASPGIEWLTPDAAARRAPATAGFVLANEFFDAFPVHRLVGTPDGPREVSVDLGATGFQEHVGPLSTPRIAERLAREDIRLDPGQRAELAFGHGEWFAEVRAWLRRGVAVVIDYAHPASELYGPRRRAGTLLGYLDHRVVDDPLAHVGRQDLTAHVDLTALADAAGEHGFTALGTTTQARYLIALGLEDLLERRRADPHLGLGDYLALRSGLARLLDPRHTGGFTVAAFGREAPPTVTLPGALPERGPTE
jgi:SAM-dependent MidA family methyltransferase